MSGWGEDSFSTPRKITFGHFRGDDFSGLLTPPLTGTDPPLTGTDPPEGRGGLRGLRGLCRLRRLRRLRWLRGSYGGTGVVVHLSLS